MELVLVPWQCSELTIRWLAPNKLNKKKSNNVLGSLTKLHEGSWGSLIRKSYILGAYIPGGCTSRQGFYWRTQNWYFESSALVIASARSHNGGGRRRGWSIATLYWDYHQRERRKNRNKLHLHTWQTNFHCLRRDWGEPRDASSWLEPDMHFASSERSF